MRNAGDAGGIAFLLSAVQIPAAAPLCSHGYGGAVWPRTPPVSLDGTGYAGGGYADETGSPVLAHGRGRSVAKAHAAGELRGPSLPGGLESPGHPDATGTF